MVSKDVIDTILRKFLTLKRMPRYKELTNKEKKAVYAKERNKIMYLSSAYFSDHWSYRKCTDTCRAMLNDKKQQFVCGLPYQLSIEEGLLDVETVLDEMAETDFNEIQFAMEYEAIWFGAANGTFFDFNFVSKNRKIKYPMLPDRISTKLSGCSDVRISPKEEGEYRILSVDVALMSSKKHNNDATAIFVNRLMPTKAGRYTSNIVYTETQEGLRTDAQALEVRKLFDEYYCDYIALDCQGIGLGIYDCLAGDIMDPETGEIYPALSCCNNDEMASRCTSPNAEKVIWSIKATAQLNSDCAYLLREGFKSGRVRLLCTEFDADNILSDIRGYKSLSDSDKAQIKLPYVNTTLLINELTNLQHEETGGKIKIYEKSGMRKDRYSSLSYNYYVAVQIENKLNKKRSAMDASSDIFIIKPPIQKRKAVNGLYGKTGKKNRAAWL